MPPTVLVVDDSPTQGPELRSILEGAGFHVTPALRAQEALDILSHNHVDLVVTEALLPDADGFDLVRRIRQLPNRPPVPIIMLTVRSTPDDYAAGFAAGVDEYFLKPVDAPKILAAGRGLIARYEVTASLPTVSHGTAPPADFSTRPRTGTLITTFSLKGGVGTSTLAVNLAVAIKQLAPSSRVGLIDLHLEEAVDALLLDIVPTSTIADWAREDMSAVSPRLLNEYFIPHRSGVSLMAGPQTPEQAETVPADVVRTTLRMAPEIFDYVVIDTASTFGEISLNALEAAAHVVLLLTPDMAALKAAVNTVRIFGALNIQESAVSYLANEIVPHAGLTRTQLETNLGKDVLVLPHAGPAFVDAANHGIPAVMHAPTNPASQAIVALARTLCIPELAEVSPTNDGLLGRLRGFRTEMRPRRTP